MPLERTEASASTGKRQEPESGNPGLIQLSLLSHPSNDVASVPSLWYSVQGGLEYIVPEIYFRMLVVGV